MNALAYPFRRIDQESKEFVEEKTAAAVGAALAEIDRVLPVVGDLLSGEEVTIEIKLKLKKVPAK